MKTKLLFHICCAPCSGWLSHHLSKDYQLVIYFDNPNIWPLEEFNKRASEAQKFFAAKSIDFVLADWNHQEWLQFITGLEQEPERGKRCKLCYYYRLEKAGKYAANHGFEYFTTSLSFSPYKDQRAVIYLGRSVAKKYQLHFIDDNFRLNNNWRQALDFSKKQSFYRQKYCGCEFTKK